MEKNQENIKIFDPNLYGKITGRIFNKLLQLNINFVDNWNNFLNGFKQESSERWNEYKGKCVILNKNWNSL